MLLFIVSVSATRWHTVNITERQPAMVIKVHHDMEFMFVVVTTEYSVLCPVAQDRLCFHLIKGQHHKL